MNGLGLIDILGIVFIVLKLVGVITWSWWLVLSPIIFGVAIGFIIGVIAYGTGIAQGKTREEIMENLMNFR